MLAAALLLLTVLAFLEQGYHATRLNLDDGGVWVVNQNLGRIGRINTQTGSLEVTLAPPANDFTLEQLDETVAVGLDGSGLAVVDVALAELGKPAKVASGADLGLGGDTAALTDPGSGKVWVGSRQRVAQFDPVTAPTLEAPPGPDPDRPGTTVTAVGVDGTVHTYREGTVERHVLRLDGEARTEALPRPLVQPEITAVGTQPVLLEPATGQLVLPGGRIVELGADRHPRLQQPGEAHNEVLVATDDALLAIDLTDGSETTLSTRGTRAPVEPVFVRGCAYAAWTATPSWSQVCAGHPERAQALPNVTRGLKTLRFRVNRGRVVLNDGTTGYNLLFHSDREPDEVDNWDEALKQGEEQDKPNEKIVQKPKDDCAQVNDAAARLEGDAEDTRPGRPVIVQVLENDRFSPCQVPLVSVKTLPPTDLAAVAVIADGTAIQVTPKTDRADPIRFEYQVAVAGKVESAPVEVSFVDPRSNREPKTKEDTTTVVAGRTVRHNVLANDRDPDGDALTLIDVKAEQGGTPTFRADGTVAYTASGGVQGEQNLTYVVADEDGKTAEGRLRVVVTPEHVNVAPTARHDRAELIVGRRQRVAVLANDSDPNSDPLTVAGIIGAASELEVTREPNGELSVLARRAGTFVFDYRITDGELIAEAKVAVTVTDVATNRPPVAVRDDLPVRPGVVANIDLLDNDVDPDGDLLAVTGITVPGVEGLSVEPVDMRVVRVTAPAGFSASVPVRYEVHDGHAASEGVLVVRPFLDGHVDQPPVVADDEISVRAGNVTAIRVLDNDTDPEGEQLTLRSLTPLAEGQGQAFVESDQLRYRAPAQGPLTVRFSYTVTDPGGNMADGIVTVRVVPAEQPNRAPVGPVVEARVFAGSEAVIPVPLVGLDPDGDVVVVTGLSEGEGEQPTKGHATPTSVGLRYRADRGAAGTDTFSFVVRDAGGLEALGTARVAVVPPPALNSPPVAVPDTYTARPGATVPLGVLDNDSDPDGDPLTLLAGGEDAPTQPRGGRVSVDASGTLVLTLDATAPESDVSFSYTVTDGRGGIDRGVVTVAVQPDLPPQPPVARDDLADPQAPGSELDIDVLANDHDPDGAKDRLQVAVVSPGVDAVVVGDKVKVRLGDRSVSFVYSITDEQDQVAHAVVSVPVMTDRPPVCETRAVDANVGEATPIDVLAGCRDPDGQPLSLVRVLAGARGGTARLEGDQVVFTPEAEVRGDAGFTFVVSDGATSAVGGMVVRVQGSNAAPEMARTHIELAAGSERVIDLAALVTDANPADRHQFRDVAGTTAQVSATLEGSRLSVRAAAEARGATATLTVTVSDGMAETTGRIDVTVLKHTGPPPVAVDDAIKTVQGRAVEIDVVANDIDPAGQGLTVEHADAAAGRGTVTRIDARRLRFTPDPDFFGEALVTYRIMDASRDAERSSAATLRVSVIGRPSRPSAPSGIRESRLVRLTWGASQPNGGPITEYVVESDKGGQRRTPSTSLVFDGLTNGTGYRFRVAAVNEAVQAGQYEFSEWSSVLVPDAAPGTPAPPVLAFGDGQVRVSWTPPPNEGTPIRSYTLRLGGGGASEARDLGPATSYVWTGLQNGTQYSFAVRATNDSGPGEWSLATNDAVNGTPAGKPGAVPDVRAQRVDPDLGQAVQLSWGTPPANGDSNFVFTVSVSPGGTTQTIRNPAQRSVAIPGLRNGVEYTFSVTATNKAGEGPAGSVKAVPAARPGPVGAVQATEGDGQVTLQAGAPNDNGAPISRWEVSTNGGAWTTIGGNFRVTGLRNGTDYTFRLRACNEVGCGDPSPASRSVTPFGAPSAPVVSASVNGSRITWSWTAANGNGRPIAHYEVYLDGSHVGNIGDRSYGRDFPNGGRHTLYVVAVNQGELKARSNTEAATTVQEAFSMTTNDGIWKDTFEVPGAGASGRHDNEVPPNSTQWVLCKAFHNPDIGSGNGWWYRMRDFGNRWMTAENFKESHTRITRTC